MAFSISETLGIYNNPFSDLAIMLYIEQPPPARPPVQIYLDLEVHMQSITQIVSLMLPYLGDQFMPLSCLSYQIMDLIDSKPLQRAQDRSSFHPALIMADCSTFLAQPNAHRLSSILVRSLQTSLI